MEENLHPDKHVKLMNNKIEEFDAALIAFKENQEKKKSLEEKLDKIVSKEPSKFWAESDARLKERQKELLVQIMQDDERDGLYDDSKKEYDVDDLKNAQKD